MDIWFFNHYAVPPWLYPLARPYFFAKYLVEKGHNVTIFAASTIHNTDENLIYDNELYKTEKIDKINYVYIRACNYKTNGIDRIKNMFDYTIRLYKIHRKFNRPDVIIATSVHPLACVVGIMVAKKYKCKCIIEIADMWPLTLVEMGRLGEKSIITKLLYKLEKWIYENADSIIFTMEGGKGYIKEKGWDKNIDLNKIYHINNGVDLNTFNEQRYKYVYDDVILDNSNMFKVIYTGSIGQANAIHYIVESAKVLKERGFNDIIFLIFGDGLKRNELENYCQEEKLSNVIFKGRVDKKYIPSILSKGNLTIFTGQNIDLYKYGLSLNKMFDYLASGKPILSNIECGYDILERYKCGLTVKGGSADALVEGILKFYNMSREEYDQYCNNSKKAAQDYDFKVLTDRLEKIIINTTK